MSTKVLLVEDVEDLGNSGDIISVKPGYARNYLLGKRKAVLADKRAIRMQERLREERLKKAEVERKESEKLAAEIEGKTISTQVKVDEEGHMYGSVTPVQIRELIEKEFNIILLKKAVQLKHPIKEVGVHTVELKLKEEVDCSIQLKIIAEVAEVAEVAEEKTEEKAAEG